MSDGYVNLFRVREVEYDAGGFNRAITAPKSVTYDTKTQMWMIVHERSQGSRPHVTTHIPPHRIVRIDQDLDARDNQNTDQ